MCAQYRPYLYNPKDNHYHDAQRAYNAWKGIATEMEKEGIHRPPMDPYLSVLSFFHTFHVIICYASQASPDPQVRPVAKGGGGLGGWGGRTTPPVAHP